MMSTWEKEVGTHSLIHLGALPSSTYLSRKIRLVVYSTIGGQMVKNGKVTARWKTHFHNQAVYQKSCLTGPIHSCRPIEAGTHVNLQSEECKCSTIPPRAWDNKESSIWIRNLGTKCIILCQWAGCFIMSRYWKLFFFPFLGLLVIIYFFKKSHTRLTTVWWNAEAVVRLPEDRRNPVCRS